MENTFGKNIIPENDAERISALNRYGILDTPPEEAFDRFTKLATKIFNTPVSLISLVDAERVFFKSNIGAGNERETPRGISLCSLAVLSPDVLVFENAPEDPCLLANPHVAAEHGLKFYAGAPLITPDNFQIGTLCVVDFTERKFSESEKAILKDLSEMVMHEIEIRSATHFRVGEYQVLLNETSSANEELSAINEELVKTQQSLQDLNNELEERVQQRTQAVEAGKHRLEAMVMNTPIAMAILKGENLIIEVANQPMLSVWRRTLDQIIGKGLIDIFPELKTQPNPERMRNVMKTGQRFALPETEVLLSTLDGELKKHYARFSYDPISEADGSVASILITIIDITDEVLNRQRLQHTSEEMAALNEELITSNEEMRIVHAELSIAVKKASENAEKLVQAIETGKMGSWSIDPLTLQVTMSDFVKNILGLPQDQNPKMESIIEAVHPDYQEMLQKALASAISDHLPSIYEYPVKNLITGEEKWVRATGKMYINAQGVAEEYFGIFMDITEAKQDELRKNDFIGMVSHELKTPLTSLTAIIQVLNAKLKTSEDTFIAGALDKANIQVKKMGTMINGFLNISRLESGKIQMDKKEFNMEELIETIIEETRLTSSSHEIKLLTCTPTTVFADEEKIGSVISNLLSNAVKYSPKGTCIELICQTKSDCVEVSVRDEGMGIKAEDQEHLFDRYYRVENPNYSHISGFDIGLYLSWEIIRQHNGRIWVNSQPGKGSIFHFSLPIAE